MPDSANIYTLSPEEPFLTRLVEAVFSDSLGLGVDYSANPLALADLTLFVPTQRAAKALAENFAKRMGARAGFLPRILPLGGFGDEDEFSNEQVDDTLVVSELERRLILARWIQGWGQSMARACIAMRPDGSREESQPAETFHAVSSFADAFGLSGELAALIDECLIEGVPFTQFETLGAGLYDDYWRITLDFLKIAFENWPLYLSQSQQVDALAQRRGLIGLQAARISAGALPGPVIAAGSTGTNQATAALLKAIAFAPRGAVVLPGLDLGLDEASFDLIAPQELATHPQYVMARLLQRLGVSRSQVKALHVAGGRARFVGEALRPAPTTDQWHSADSGAPWQKPEFFDFLSLIEAETEREEALAIAILIRASLEKPGQSVALITPERTLAERVSAELMRWSIVAEESAGRSLSRTDCGAMALHLLEATQRGDGASLLALLGHHGFSPADFAAEADGLRQIFEACVVRQGLLGATQSLSEAVTMAQDMAQGPHAAAFQQRVSVEQWDRLRAMVLMLGTVLAPLQEGGALPIAQFARAHREALARITDIGGPEGVALQGVLEELAQSPAAQLPCRLTDYQALVRQILTERTVPHFRAGHPRLAILGVLEARLLSFDHVILAGLDEKIWPPQAQSGALLNRPMRHALGLSSPERRLGQTAHDFVMGFCHGQVTLTRAHKRGGEPSVASRLLQRLQALGGEGLDACRARGAYFLSLARAIDQDYRPPIARPEPRPPIALRPVRLSVTAVEKLRRDPYSIYAERILGLPVLGPLQADFQARDFGTSIHRIFEMFARAGTALPAQPEARLLTLAKEVFGARWDAPDFQAFGRGRVEAILDAFLRWERARRGGLAEIHTEIEASYGFGLSDGSAFKLTAKADRADYDREGTVHLIDFKTGAVPSASQIKAGFAPQLTLEAKLVELGAFKLPKAKAITATYAKFGRDAKLQEVGTEKGTSLKELSDQHFSELRALLDQLRDEQTPYRPRPFPQFVKDVLDYDHLSRFKEWSTLGAQGEGE